VPQAAEVNVLDGLGDIWLWPTACRQQACQSFPCRKGLNSRTPVP